MNSPLRNGVVFLLLIVTGCDYNEKEKYFSGMIEYVYTYESNVLDSDSLTNVRPAKGVFKYDLGSYQSSFWGKDTITYSYSGLFNKCLSQTGSITDYECEDYSIATDSVLNWKLYPTSEIIMGHSCKIFEMQKRSSWVKYYISEEAKIAPATYNKHRAYNMDIYGKNADGGLILKLEHRFKYFSMKGLAVDLSKKDNQYKAFEITDTIFINHCK